MEHGSCSQETERRKLVFVSLSPMCPFQTTAHGVVPHTLRAGLPSPFLRNALTDMLTSTNKPSCVGTDD